MSRTKKCLTENTLPTPCHCEYTFSLNNLQFVTKNAYSRCRHLIFTLSTKKCLTGYTLPSHCYCENTFSLNNCNLLQKMHTPVLDTYFLHYPQKKDIKFSHCVRSISPFKYRLVVNTITTIAAITIALCFAVVAKHCTTSTAQVKITFYLITTIRTTHYYSSFCLCNTIVVF